MSHECLSLQILGPLQLWRGGVELDAGPRQQAYLLALLLARAGRPISTTELIDLVWDDDAPATAVNTVQKYVGALRRLLEPALPVRGASSYLLRRGTGYVFAARPGMVDAVTFRGLVKTARTHLAGGRSDAALDDYAQALRLWRGPAGGGLAPGLEAMPVFTALNEEFFDACVAAAQVAVSQGRPDLVLQQLQLAASMAPLHERVQAGLVAVLDAAGRRAEALSMFQTVRTRLADELGVDPGPALQAAFRACLDQPATVRADGGPLAMASTTPPAQPSAAGPVGRTDDVAVLRRAVDSAFAGGAGLAIVEGEPGAGKTHLLEEIAAEADRRGALIAWGGCLAGDGTPAMWPWLQAGRTLLDSLPDAAREDWRSSEFGCFLDSRRGDNAVRDLPAGDARFRLFEQAVALVGQVSVVRPVVLVVDDLQWADTASLELFAHLATRLPPGSAAISALRDRAPAPRLALTRMLAAASRLPVIAGSGSARFALATPPNSSTARPDTGPTRMRPAPSTAAPAATHSLSRSPDFCPTAVPSVARR